MKKSWLIVVSAVFFVFFSLTCLAADIKGWGKTKWGMTEAQITDLYPESRKVRENERPEIRLEIKNLNIEGDKFDARFWFDRQGKLSEVILYPPVGTPTVSLFSSLEASLTKKYGAPSLRNKQPTSLGGMEHETVWTLPSTTIELSFLQAAKLLKIHYKSRAKTQDSNL